MQPLKGIKVLDFSTLLPGPLAGLVLAQAGADVIKVERPEFGEEMRHWPPKMGKDGVNFTMLNRGKKSVAVDLKDKESVQKLRPLIEQADIVIEQFRPGVMARLGLDYETLKNWNPRLIYCSITGYGQTGPLAGDAGHDLNYIAQAGLLSLSMGPQENPTLPPVLTADLAGGTYPAIVNILMALIGREKTGQGTYLDISMTDNLFMLTGWAQGQGNATGNWPKSGDSLVTGGSPRYQVYQTSDGRFVAAAPIEEKFWQTFCKLIDLPADLVDSKDVGKVIAAIRAIIGAQTADFWAGVFKGQDCCCNIVNTLKEAVESEHARQRKIFEFDVIGDDGTKIPGLPVCLARQFTDHDNQTESAPEVGDISIEQGFDAFING